MAGLGDGCPQILKVGGLLQGQWEEDREPEVGKRMEGSRTTQLWLEDILKGTPHEGSEGTWGWRGGGRHTRRTGPGGKVRTRLHSVSCSLAGYRLPSRLSPHGWLRPVGLRGVSAWEPFSLCGTSAWVVPRA